MGRNLQPHFAAGVKTTDLTTIATPLGPIVQNVEVHVPQGGELPDNLADGELERLERLGAFTPLPPLEERVRAQGARIDQLLATAPEGEAVATPGVRPVDDDMPPPLPTDGPESPAVRHATAPEAEAPDEPGRSHRATKK